MKRFFEKIFVKKEQTKNVNVDTPVSNRSNEDKQFNVVKINLVEIGVPEFLSEAKEIKILKYNYKVGDFIRKGDILCEIETDTYSLDFESFYSGKITNINRNREVKINDILLTLEITQ
ncbi:lipoyl domain-containing protein [Tenacibaculum agarivorans]|uniref:lipoyl domain-containing protein n=1 Tax=Tenacibaculum agarivorans TaxID=1908389 RepID=UPI00094BB3D2|nr:lipoyl domain-containing protein [Tenacibaculum agarivorans]